jgi:signal transduction histidine kinase/CheY-like chemotaxis protein
MMKEFVKKLFCVNNSNHPHTLKEVRKHLLSKLLIINILVFPVLLLGSIEAIKLQQFFVAISFAVLYLPILTAFLFQNKLPYTISVLLLLFSGISIGVVNIIVYGFSGAGLPIFCFMGVLAALFLGSRAGYITIILCSIPMIIVAILMTNNLLSVGVELMEISTLPISWATAIIVMLFLGSMMIFGFGILQRNLSGSLKYSQTQALDLLEANNEYETINEELKESNEELYLSRTKAEESDRLKTAFLANMSHEIRTPMNGILGFTGLLKKPMLSGERQQQYIRIIEESGARMLTTLNDIIDIAKIESRLIQVSVSEINLNEQMNELFEFFLPETTKKNIHFSITKRLPDQQANIKTDKEKLNSVLINLIKNAIKYTNAGKIEFACLMNGKSRGSEVEFYVKDTGIGIPKLRLKAIFDRFVQADIKDSQAYEGSGLGLAICKAYVEMLGGKIWVESKKGVGSQFHFTIPYLAKDIEIPNKKIEDTNKQESIKMKLKILIVEDEEFSIEYLKAILEECNKEILVAETGVEAVKMCRENPDLDLILMDIKIPEIDGYEATRRIREFNKDVFILAQTAFAQSGDREKCIEAGCNDYITKPINQDNLLEIITNHF